jgi:2-deoxy-D-gluconate 3-dehydrogenase
LSDAHPPPQPFAGQVALVSGASRGIGREVVLKLAASGADVIGVGRDLTTMREVREAVEGTGAAFHEIAADLRNAPSLQHVVEEAHGWRGRIDVLVNCAGMTVRSADLELDHRAWDEVFALNARAPFLLSQQVASRMLDAGGGAIVNLTSVAGVVTTGASVAYSASKAAVIQLTKVLAARWAPTVRVNAVGPAYVATDMSADWLADPANRDFVIAHTPMGRLAEPGDVAAAVLFLASSDASYITGHHLVVDGGWTA